MQLSFTDYLREVLVMKREHPLMRMGQCYYNVFHDIDPEHAEFLTTLETIDCYHDDGNIGNFVYEVAVTWESRKQHHKK